MKKLTVAAVAAMMLAGTANAAVTVDIRQSGTSVVATSNGSINTDGLRPYGGGNEVPFVNSGRAYLVIGDPSINFGAFNAYGLSGPSNFGTSSTYTEASSSVGEVFGILGSLNRIFLPVDYISGTSLSATSVFDNASITSLALTPGTYVYLLPHDTFTINIQAVAAAVPEPATWGMMILGMGAVGFALRRRQKVTTGVSFA